MMDKKLIEEIKQIIKNIPIGAYVNLESFIMVNDSDINLIFDAFKRKYELIKRSCRESK